MTFDLVIFDWEGTLMDSRAIMKEKWVLFEGAYDLLERLSKTGVHLAVATGKSRVGLNHVFERTDTGQFFSASRCADECHSKPHPQMLIELMDIFDVKPQRTVMIGDTAHDLIMANAAKVAGIGLTTGLHTLELLQQAHPRHCFDSLEKLAPLLLAYCEKRI